MTKFADGFSTDVALR